MSGDIPELFTALEQQSMQQLKVKREKSNQHKNPDPNNKNWSVFESRREWVCHVGAKRRQLIWVSDGSVVPVLWELR